MTLDGTRPRPVSAAASGRLIYVSVQGYGDALISLQLLQRAGALPAPLLILGSTQTVQVQDCVLRSKFEIVELFAGHARFYKLRTAGLRAVFSDLRLFRRWIAENLRADDRLLFEKRDWRNRLLSGALGRHAVAPAHTGSVYIDRKRMIEALTGRAIELPRCVRPPRPPVSALINPSAGAPEREIGHGALRSLTSLLRRRQCRVTLVDPDGRFAHDAASFDEYHGRIALIDAAALLRRHDLYVGPDSFFIHLAYHCQVPFFAVLPHKEFAFDFAPPGSREARNFIALDEVVDGGALERRLGDFLGW
jgi:hypothetical protein